MHFRQLLSPLGAEKKDIGTASQKSLTRLDYVPV